MAPGCQGAESAADVQLHSMIVRLSLPGEDAHGGPRPDPNYGDQFQNQGLSGPFPDFAYHTAPVPPEAALFLDWQEHTEVFPDGLIDRVLVALAGHLDEESSPR